MDHHPVPQVKPVEPPPWEPPPTYPCAVKPDPTLPSAEDLDATAEMDAAVEKTLDGAGL